MCFDYDYNPGEHLRKHKNNKSAEANFGWWSGQIVGKCPKGFDLALARSILNEGVPDPPLDHEEAEGPDPKRLYNLHEGVVYCASSANDGTYHAYPVGPGKRTPVLPRHVSRKLKERAQNAGNPKAVDDYLEWAEKRVKDLQG